MGDEFDAIRDQIGHWGRTEFHDFANKINLLLGEREVDKYRYADIGRQLEKIDRTVTQLAEYVRVQNGRTFTLEHKVTSLESSRTRQHGITPDDHVDAERRPITRREVWLVAASVGGGAAILKFLDWLSQVGK